MALSAEKPVTAVKKTIRPVKNGNGRINVLQGEDFTSNMDTFFDACRSSAGAGGAEVKLCRQKPQLAVQRM